MIAKSSDYDARSRNNHLNNNDEATINYGTYNCNTYSVVATIKNVAMPHQWTFMYNTLHFAFL